MDRIVKDQNVWKQEGYIVDRYSKAFAIPILTAIRKATCSK